MRKIVLKPGITVIFMKSYSSTVVKGTIIIFAMLLLSGLLGYATRLFLASNLSLAEYGMFYAALSFASFFIIIIGLGLNSALTKFVSEFLVNKKYSKIKTVSIIVILTQIFVSVVVVIFMTIFADQISLIFFKTLQVSDIIKILFIYLFLSTPFYFLKNYLQGHNDMKNLAFISFVYPIVTFAYILFAFYFSSGSVLTAAHAYTAGVFVAVLFGIFVVAKKYGHVFKGRIVSGIEKKKLSRDLFLFAVPVFIIGIANTAITYVDTLAITYFRTLEEVAFYQAALPTAFILTYLSSSLTTVLYPTVSDLWTRKKYQYTADAISSIVKFTLILMVPIVLVFLAFPEIVLTILFGSSYIPAAPALQILSIGVLMFSLGMLLTITLQGIGRPDINAKLIGFSAIVNLVLNLVMVPGFGIIGAATASAISYFCYISLAHYFTKREFSKKNTKFILPYKTMAKTLLGGFIALAIIFFLKGLIDVQNPIIELVIIGFISIVFYVLWILFTRSVRYNDVNEFRKSGLPVPLFVINILKK